MARPRRPRRHDAGPEQLPLGAPEKPAPPMPGKSIGPAVAHDAKVALARRAKISAVPGHVRLSFTLDVPHAVAERLVARAIREGRNLDALVVELLEDSAR